MTPDAVHTSARRGDVLPFGSLRQARIEFVVALVVGESVEIVWRDIGTVVDIADDSNANVDLIGPLIVMTFGEFPFPKGLGASTATLIAALQKNLGARVKIVHGACLGHHGLIGSETTCVIRYGVLLPQWDAILAKLAHTRLGHATALESQSGQPVM